MKPTDRDALLIRLDERMDGVKTSISRMWKAVSGLYILWGMIIAGVVVAASRLGE